MRKLLSLFFVIILAGCGPVTPVAASPAKVPQIKFESPNVHEQMQENYNFDLNVGIYAIDKDNVFLVGSIGEFTHYPIQSTILKSGDGGQHWIEVMKPERTSRVIAFQLLPSGTGWALLVTTNEGIGPTTLFHTTDFGNSWSKLLEISRDSIIAFPSFMHFANETSGQIDMIHFGSSDGNYIVHLSTYDGGKTWEETGRYYPKFDDYASQMNITSAYKNLGNYSNSVSLDRYSWWKVETNNKEVVISRKLPKPVNDATGWIIWQEWETITTLPLRLNYENGIITMP